MRHPLAGLFVKLHANDRAQIAVVERVTVKRRTNRVVVVARLHHPETAVALDHLTGDARKAWFVGRRVSTPVTSLIAVHPGENEAWIEAAEFMEWAERGEVAA